jgi:hypothetical protein
VNTRDGFIARLRLAMAVLALAAAGLVVGGGSRAASAASARHAE